MMPVATAAEVFWSGPQLDLMIQRVASTISSISMACSGDGGIPPAHLPQGPPHYGAGDGMSARPARVYPVSP